MIDAFSDVNSDIMKRQQILGFIKAGGDMTRVILFLR